MCNLMASILLTGRDLTKRSGGPALSWCALLDSVQVVGGKEDGSLTISPARDLLTLFPVYTVLTAFYSLSWD